MDDNEIEAEVDEFLEHMSRVVVMESFFVSEDRINVAIGHDLHTGVKFMNITFEPPSDSEDLTQLHLALDFDAANKLVQQAMIVGNAIWGEGDEDDE